MSIAAANHEKQQQQQREQREKEKELESQKEKELAELQPSQSRRNSITGRLHRGTIRGSPLLPALEGDPSLVMIGARIRASS